MERESWRRRYRHTSCGGRPTRGTTALYVHLGAIYGNLGNPEKALEEAREAMRLEPNSAANYEVLGIDYMNLNRLDEAEAVYKQAEERKLESEWLLVAPLPVGFPEG